MPKNSFRTLALLTAILSVTPAFAQTPAPATDWAASFHTPPLSAHPQIWWHWMNGNVTREGITADLEAMHRVGIQEATIVTVASDIPPGPVPVMSPQFFDMVEFSAKEAKRLGMTLCIGNCPGWSSSGGPWVSPELSMQFITTSETRVTGPTTFNATLPQPPSKLNYYKDIALLAFKTTTGESAPPLRSLHPTLTSSVPNLDLAPLIDGDPKTAITLPTPLNGPPQFLQLTFDQPFTARTLTITAGTMRAAGGTIEVSDDGKTFHTLQPFDIPRNPTAPVYISLGEKPVTARAFRFNFTHAAAASQSIILHELELSTRLFIPSIGEKALFEANAINPLQVEHDSHTPASPDVLIPATDIINLTAQLKPDGSLSWQVPPGNWTLLRIGHTTTGKTNHPAPPEATGLECDKFSKAGLDASWNGMMQPLLDRLGSLSPSVLDDCLIDSYEVGGQNWTPLMASEFQKRRGYDLTPFLPTFTGRVVDSPERTERFLWDFRRTVSDLFAENYYDYFTELCHKHNLHSMIEPYTGPFESLRAGATNDIPMGEFWTGSNGHPSIYLAASVGHTYGQTVIAAESLTGTPSHGQWTDDPYSLKSTGDIGLCAGINRFVFHRFAHQPWMDKFPGMTMGQWGINLDRTNTWFELATPWMTYLSRSQFLLQQGIPVADVAYFCGESAPVLARTGTPPLPAGYFSDSINSDVLLHRASVKNHRLLLADGVSYAVLVLPQSDPTISPELLRKLHDFASDGLTILGPRPLHAPGLTDYPHSDEEVKSLADDMWATIGTATTEHPLGQGKIITGQPLTTVLQNLHLAPDFSTDDTKDKNRFHFIHRTAPQGDLYFVANHDDAISAQCTFRIAGKIPELWHPDTGLIEPAPLYTTHDGLTTIPLDFAPSGSLFVLFRTPDQNADHLATTQSNNPNAYELHTSPDNTTTLTAWQPGTYTFTTSTGQTRTADASALPAPLPIEGPWQLTFPPHWGAPEHATFDKLISWPTSDDNGIKYFSGTATYAKQITIPDNLLTPSHRLYLSLGTVKNLAQISLNGKDLGILWKPPFQVDITDAAHPGANDLEIKLTNLWPNRLIGDEQLPEDVEWNGMKLARFPQWLLDGKPSPTGRLTFTTWHHITKDMPLLPSGLLGPVELHPTQQLPLK